MQPLRFINNISNWRQASNEGDVTKEESLEKTLSLLPGTVSLTQTSSSSDEVSELGKDLYGDDDSSASGDNFLSLRRTQIKLNSYRDQVKMLELKAAKDADAMKELEQAREELATVEELYKNLVHDIEQATQQAKQEIMAHQDKGTTEILEQQTKHKDEVVATQKDNLEEMKEFVAS